MSYLDKCATVCGEVVPFAPVLGGALGSLTTKDVAVWLAGGLAGYALFRKSHPVLGTLGGAGLASSAKCAYDGKPRLAVLGAAMTAASTAAALHWNYPKWHAIAAYLLAPIPVAIAAVPFVMDEIKSGLPKKA